MIQIRLTDFGLAGDRLNKTKIGGTPVYASEMVFGGDQMHADYYSYGRLLLFLALEKNEDFIQLCFLPIEDKTLLKTIRNAIRSFDIIKQILDKYLKYGNKNSYTDLSKCSKVKISRNDLINSGVPSTWFLDSLLVGRDTIQSQNFNCQNLK